MGDDARAIGTFRMLVSRFDTSKHHINSYYILYRMYLNENRIDSSDFFKNQILYKYPNSDYAKIIRDPSGSGPFSKKCENLIEKQLGVKKALLVIDNPSSYDQLLTTNDDLIKLIKQE